MLSWWPAPTQPQHKSRKRKRQECVDDVDTALLSWLDSLQEENQDKEGAFGEKLVLCLHKFSSRQKAIAYIEINKLLLIQFPNDPYFVPSHCSSQFPYSTPLQHSSSEYAPQNFIVFLFLVVYT